MAQKSRNRRSFQRAKGTSAKVGCSDCGIMLGGVDCCIGSGDEAVDTGGSGVRVLRQNDAAGGVSFRDGGRCAVVGAVRGDRAILSEAGQWPAASRGRADAAHLFLAAVVQSVGPGGGGSALRFAGDARSEERRVGK